MPASGRLTRATAKSEWGWQDGKGHRLGFVITAGGATSKETASPSSQGEGKAGGGEKSKTAPPDGLKCLASHFGKFHPGWLSDGGWILGTRRRQ